MSDVWQEDFEMSNGRFAFLVIVAVVAFFSALSGMLSWTSSISLKREQGSGLWGVNTSVKEFDYKGHNYLTREGAIVHAESCSCKEMHWK